MFPPPEDSPYLEPLSPSLVEPHLSVAHASPEGEDGREDDHFKFEQALSGEEHELSTVLEIVTK